jgi:hypothetical protein
VNLIYQQFDRLLSFASVHHAIRGERLLKAVEVEVVALPTPREIDISCGQCLLFNSVNEERVLSELMKEHVQWSKLFRRDVKARVYEEIGREDGV